MTIFVNTYVTLQLYWSASKYLGEDQGISLSKVDHKFWSFTAS